MIRQRGLLCNYRFIYYNKNNMTIYNENKKGYKNTKIGWIPDEWEVKKLSNIGVFLKGKGIRKDEIIPEGIPAVRYGEIYTMHDDYIKYFSSFISDTSAKNSNKLVHGDLLFAGSGESLVDIGKCIAFPYEHEAYAGGDIIILRNHKQESIFMGYLMNHELFKRQTYNLGQGHSVVHIYASSLKGISIPLPPLPEQKKIAEILSTWDKAIEQSQKLIEKLILRKKGLMQQLLTGSLRLISDSGQKFNGEWMNLKLGDIADRITQKNLELNDTVVTISAQRGFVKQEDYFKKRVASDTLSGYYLIDKGDFAYNKSYSKGYPMGAFKRLNDLDKAVVTTLYICFSIKDIVCSDYMVYFFEGGLMTNNLMKIAQEGGRAHGLLNISLGDFFSLKLTIPPLSEQTAIAKVLTTADEEIQTQKSFLAKLQLQKKGLMQQLLTGQKRVNI